MTARRISLYWMVHLSGMFFAKAEIFLFYLSGKNTLRGEIKFNQMVEVIHK